ncbi:MAG: TAXI family TRAP transporter solute-binding subunit [Pseudomonadota bacterium]
MTSYRLGLALFTVLFGIVGAYQNFAAAQSATPRAPARVPTNDEFRAKLNENVVTIISGNPNGGFLYTAYDIAAVLDDGDELRVLPIVGRGGAQNIKDVLYLRGIDMGIMHPHLIAYYKDNGELGPNIDRRIAYVTTLFADELHVVASKDINTFADLAGKRVNFSDKGSGTQLSMKLIFRLLKMDVQEFNMGQADAFEKIKNGELDATLCTCAKPLRSVKGISPDDGLKLVPVPYSPELEELFLPGFITHKDYPNMLPAGEQIETISVQTILGVYNWTPRNPRYPRIAKFVNAFFNNISKFHQPPRQPKWRGLNIAATVKTLQRFPAAQEWLDKNAPRLTGAASASGDVAVDTRLARRQAQAAAPGDPAMQERLFREFMEWMRRRQSSAPSQ